MYIKYSYKCYKESKIATAVSVIGGIFNAIGKIVLVVLLIQLLKGALGSTKVEKSNLYLVIIFTIITSVVMFVMGFLCNLIAKKIAFKEFQRRLKLTCEEVEGLVDKKPKLKEWFMENHINYREIHKNDISYASINNIETENSDVTRDKKKKLLTYYFIIIIVVTGIIFVANTIGNSNNGANANANANASSSSSPSALNNEKYQCYIQLNNDIVDCYELSINIYLNDKGINEKIEDSNEVQITPIFDDSYKNLQKAREAVNQKPKMDIDKDIIKLTDATEKIYDLIREIDYAYGGQEYIKKTNKTKKELHKEFLVSIQEYDGLYENFSQKLDKLSIEYMGKELEEYKNNKDMDSYYTLDIMIESQKIYEYFVENNITNENLFDMNLEEYNGMLKEYNKKFEAFEKQNIKGPTVHTKSFCEFSKAYHSFVNNIVNMVKEKNFDEGKLDAPKGLVSPNEKDDIQKRLYFYIDRMTSSYNSIQGFKKL